MPAILSMFWTFILISQAGWTPADPTPAIAPLPEDASVLIEDSPSDSGRFETGHALARVRFGDEEVPYAVMAVFALPGEEVPVEILDAIPGAGIEASAGTLRPLGDGRWGWRAPETPGNAILQVSNGGHDSASVTLHAFVMVPYGEMKNGRVRGYRIGPYPRPRSSRTHEARPRGFIEVTAHNMDLPVSPHFRLGQFVCKEGEGFPKYIVLQSPLLLRLENLLASVNERGLEAATFQVMSAYRTPWYNRAIGNTTSFTRHQYGDAADIFVDDLPADGRMDDLNRDGRFDRRDAMVLHEIAEETEGRPEAGGREGGLSAYAPNHAHGAFVHVDTRGYEARW